MKRNILNGFIFAALACALALFGAVAPARAGDADAGSWKWSSAVPELEERTYDMY